MSKNYSGGSDSDSGGDQKILLSRQLRFFFRPNQDVDRLVSI
jgi:hypothetical protein